MHQGGTLIIFPFAGIGDVMWCLPHIRAIARQEGAITLLTRPRTMAKEWLNGDPCVKQVIYVESKLRDTLRLIRKGNFSKSWTLHKSLSHALLPFLARIPERVGLGLNKQNFLLTTKSILPLSMQKQHVIQQLDALIHLHGLSYTSQDGYPVLCKMAQQAIKIQFLAFPRPWICFGIGGSETYKKWPIEHFIELGTKISKQHKGTIFLCGGSAEAAEALQIQQGITQNAGQAETVTHLPIMQTFAFIAEMDLYIGNDTGLLNIAARFQIPTLGLFGATPVLNYSHSIHALQCSNKNVEQYNAMKEIKPALVYNTLKQQKWLEV